MNRCQETRKAQLIDEPMESHMCSSGVQASWWLLQALATHPGLTHSWAAHLDEECVVDAEVHGSLGDVADGSWGGLGIAGLDKVGGKEP